MNNISKNLFTILKKIFPKSSIPRKKNPKIGDFAEWDSLGHLNFLLTVEKSYRIKFSMNEMVDIKSFEDIEKVILKKKKL